LNNAMANLLRIEQAVAVAARAYNIEPALIMAVIQTESSFKVRAISPAGAKGLMQLMDGTAILMGVSDVFNIEQNVMGGTRYLSEMIAMFGSTRKALVAYNWGPGNLAKYGMDKMPRETRDYLKKVTAAYYHYESERN